MDIAKTEVKLVKTKFHPIIDGSWNYYQVDEPAFDQDDHYWIATLKLKIPLFDGSLRLWELKEKRRSLRQAKLSLEALEDKIRLEVKEATLNVQTDESVLNNLTKQVELAEKNYDIIFAKFEFGSATSLELDEALTTLGSAKTELITKIYDHQITLLNLERVVGLFAMDYKDKNLSSGHQ